MQNFQFGKQIQNLIKIVEIASSISHGAALQMMLMRPTPMMMMTTMIMAIIMTKMMTMMTTVVHESWRSTDLAAVGLPCPSEGVDDHDDDNDDDDDENHD